MNINFDLKFPQILGVPQINHAYPMFVNQTCLEWYYFDYDPSATVQTKNYVGQNDGNKKKSGLLENIIQTNCKINNLQEFQTDKKFQIQKAPFFIQTKNAQDMQELIYDTITYINEQPIFIGDRQETAPGLEFMPDGAVTFIEANDKKLKYNIQINDCSISLLHRNNGVTKFLYYIDGKPQNYLDVPIGQIHFQDIINKAYINQLNDKVHILSSVVRMPSENQEDDLLNKLLSYTASALIPLSLSLLLPVFLSQLVHEKEEKTLQMMVINGLKLRYYWLQSYFFFMILSCITYGIFFFVGKYVLNLLVFTQTSSLLFILSFLGWAHCQSSMSIFLSTLIKSSSTATILGYLFSILITIISISLNQFIYPYPENFPFFFTFMPPLTISRIFYLTGYSCSLFGCFSSIFHLPQELQMCLIQLYTAGTLYLIFGIYLQEVLPKDFGLQKKPLFFLEKYKHLFKQKPNLKLLSEIHDKDQNSFQQSPDSIEDINAKLNNQQNIVDVQNLSDPGIIEEIQKIEHIFDYKQFAMVTKNLKKTYKPVGGRKQHTAVKDFYLSVERGEIFGLLGPNGAGKTTLISMLTGALPPTQGDAWIGGFNIQTQQDQLHSIIGVCPQFDLLWSNLTIYEHLEFYARLKGISEVQIPYQIDTVLKEVKLFNFKNKLAKSLSGGMRRRLSVAISLIGNPHIIFLDEPSTGLDPDNRRQMWEILSHNKGKRAMILTTHSMEEADVLCQRIGIVTQGQLRCVGSQQRLKTVYGQGFHIEINCRKEKYFEQKLYQENSNISLNEIQKQAVQLAKQNQKFCKQKLYQNIKNLYEVQDFNGNMIFQVPREGTSISHIYKLLKQNKDDWFIEDYGISQSSLEDVFLEVVQKDY